MAKKLSAKEKQEREDDRERRSAYKAMKMRQRAREKERKIFPSNEWNQFSLSPDGTHVLRVPDILRQKCERIADDLGTIAIEYTNLRPLMMPSPFGFFSALKGAEWALRAFVSDNSPKTGRKKD